MKKEMIENTTENIVKVLKEICLEYRTLSQELEGSKLTQGLLQACSIYETVIDMFEDKEYFNDLAINYLRR